ncbi:hypothetical protein PMAYCL1PPCAC_13920, partial [Pristionchus mayeri]
ASFKISGEGFTEDEVKDEELVDSGLMEIKDEPINFSLSSLGANKKDPKEEQLEPEETLNNDAATNPSSNPPMTREELLKYAYCDIDFKEEAYRDEEMVDENGEPIDNFAPHASENS